MPPIRRKLNRNELLVSWFGKPEGPATAETKAIGVQSMKDFAILKLWIYCYSSIECVLRVLRLTKS